MYNEKVNVNKCSVCLLHGTNISIKPRRVALCCVALHMAKGIQYTYYVGACVRNFSLYYAVLGCIDGVHSMTVTHSYKHTAINIDMHINYENI